MDRLLKYSTLISSFLIYIGFLKLKFFYDNFNININQYIDLTEIISSFLNDLNIIFVVIIISFLHHGIGMYIMNKSIDKNRGKETNYQVMYRYFDKIFSSKKKILTVLLFSLPISIVSYVLYWFHSFNICIYTFVIFALQSIILIFEAFKIHKLDDNVNLTRIIPIIIVTGILAYMLANNDYKKINNTDYSGIIIKTDDGSIKLSKKDTYIGKTKNYLFIKKNGRTDVISNSIINKISFPK